MRSFLKKDRQVSPGQTMTEGEARVFTTILIVDDSPTEIHVIKGIVEKGGYKVITADSGENGIVEATNSKPDLILMDVVMPGLNGFQATRQLSRNPDTAEIPIIMVTTKGQETDRAWGLRQGAREYVVKPVAPDDLLNKIRMVLQS